MKAKTIITKHLVWFTITTLLLSIGFRLLLNFLLNEQLYVFSDVAGAVYGASVFAAGWLFGEKEGRHLPINDMGFRYNLATFLVFNLVWGGWIVLGLNGEYGSLRSLYGIALIWSPLLLIHLFLSLRLRKKSIEGLDKEDIFE